MTVEPRAVTQILRDNVAVAPGLGYRIHCLLSLKSNPAAPCCGRCRRRNVDV
jgi:hypothetical protein